MFMICFRYVCDRTIINVSATFRSPVTLHQVYISLLLRIIPYTCQKNQHLGRVLPGARGEKRDRGDGRSEAQKKADAKYFEAYVIGPLRLFALPISCLSLTVIKR